MKLFCIPFAGGSESMYFEWQKYLSSTITLNPVLLKGRGRKINEKFYSSIEEAVDDIFKHNFQAIEDENYAIYGHSMGGLLAYEIYYKIIEEGIKEPSHLFFSGCKAPHLSREKKKISDLSDEKLLLELEQMGGTKKEFIDNNELMEIFLPVIRSDFNMIEKYNYIQKDYKINCGVTILNGNRDDITLTELLSWKELIQEKYKIHNLDGDHFFLESNLKNITSIINYTLTQ